MLKNNRRVNECPFYLDLDTPTPIQMKSVVKGNDPYYQIQPRRSRFRGYAVLVFFLLIVAFGSFVVIAVVTK